MLLYANAIQPQSAPSLTLRRSPEVLRRCACGGSGMAGGQCAECRKKRQSPQRSPVVSGGGGGASLLQREGDGKAAPSSEEKMKEAAKKVGEAFLETEPGKEIKKQASELGEKFVSSLAGKVVAGSAIAGALGYIVAKNKELPMQLPEIPLDKVKPGLRMRVTWEGPVRDPAKAMITFTYTPGAGSAPKKPTMTEKEKFRAETAKMAAEQAAFREGLKSPEEKAAEEEAFWKAYWGGMGKYGLRPLAIPGVGPEKEKKEEETPLRREPSGRSGGAPAVAPPIVEETLASGGSSLPRELRAHMEQQFGHDFGHVRVHADTRADASAAAVGARAYTVGSAVVFAAGQYAPHTETGRRLVAHELAHVVQQDGGRNAIGNCQGIAIGAVDDPQEREAESLARAVARDDGSPAPPVERQADAASRAVSKSDRGAARTQVSPLRLQRAPATPTGIELAEAKPFGHADLKSDELKQKRRTYIGSTTLMRVTPAGKYKGHCVKEYLTEVANTCPPRFAELRKSGFCTESKCLDIDRWGTAGDAETGMMVTDGPDTFLDRHRTHHAESLLEGTGKSECSVVCHQLYKFDRKDELGAFYVIRNFRAGSYKPAGRTTALHITTGEIRKVAAPRAAPSPEQFAKKEAPRLKSEGALAEAPPAPAEAKKK